MITKIFVLSLLDSKERREHIKQEFSKVGIKEYEFINAVSSDSARVDYLRHTNFGSTKCVRCGEIGTAVGNYRKQKNRILGTLKRNPDKLLRKFKFKPKLGQSDGGQRTQIAWIKKNIDKVLAKLGHREGCSCGDKRSHLRTTQLGNWCSFIDIMTTVVDARPIENLVMVCEDDVKFVDNGFEKLSEVLDKKVFEKYNISMKKPLLIRIGSGYSEDHEYQGELELIEKVTMSNPCFVFNPGFARCFLKYLKQITTTSDVYMHRDLPILNKTIQAWTIMPQLAYELSTGKYRQFPSQIAVGWSRPSLDHCE